jgi:predicted SAM-dependent methyltransferase
VRELNRELLNLIARRARREARRVRSLIAPPAGIQGYLDKHDVRKLQIGAGPNRLSGWLNTDRDPLTPQDVYLDAARRFPLPDQSFDYIFSEHQIEHLSYNQGIFMLGECFRVLRPGGRIRIATPDLATIAALATSELSPRQRNYVQWVIETFVPEARGELPAFVINNLFYSWGHRFLYDEPTLSDALARVGFTCVRRYGMGESDDAALGGLEAHGVAQGDEALIRFETMILEAAGLPKTRSPNHATAHVDGS